MGSPEKGRCTAPDLLVAVRVAVSPRPSLRSFWRISFSWLDDSAWWISRLALGVMSAVTLKPSACLSLGWQSRGLYALPESVRTPVQSSASQSGFVGLSEVPRCCPFLTSSCSCYPHDSCLSFSFPLNPTLIYHTLVQVVGLGETFDRVIAQPWRLAWRKFSCSNIRCAGGEPVDEGRSIRKVCWRQVSAGPSRHQ